MFKSICCVDSKTSKRITIAIVSVVMFMEFLDTTILNTAVPSIAKSFHQDPLLLKFSLISYFLSLALFTPISGWCADVLGAKRVFLTSVCLFVLSSFLCAISTNVIQLTLFRFLQGMGGALMNPVSRIIILRIVNPKELVRVQGFIFTPAMLGFILGPFLGGFITTYLSWPWIFYINLPAGLLVFVFGFLYLQPEKELFFTKFDFMGFVLCAISLCSISFSVDMTGHDNIVPQNIVLAFGFIGILFLFLLIIHCLNKKNSILDFKLFKIRTFRIGLTANFTMYMLFASIAFILPLMYQSHFFYTPFYSGILILPIAFGQLIFRFFAPRIIHKVGFKISMLFFGCLTLTSILAISFIQLNSSIYFIIFSEVLFGSSFITFCSSTGALNYIDVSKAQSAKATSLDLTSRQVASSLGVGVSALLIHFFRQKLHLSLSGPGGDKVFHYTLLLLSLLVASSLIQALQLGRKEGHQALKV